MLEAGPELQPRTGLQIYLRLMYFGLIATAKRMEVNKKVIRTIMGEIFLVTETQIVSLFSSKEVGLGNNFVSMTFMGET